MTARKQAEIRLSEQEQFLRSVYEGVEYVIATMEVSEPEDVRFIGLNPLGEQVTGIAAAQFCGKTPEQVFPRHIAETVRTYITQCLQTGTSVTWEECLPFQKQKNWWSNTLTPLRNETGRIHRIICTSIDITDRKHAEDALRQQTTELEHTLQELQRTQTQLVQSEKMSSLGQLVAGVAHEINNPVNFIYGNLNHANAYTQDLLNLLTLYQQHYPQPNPEIQDAIEEIDLAFLSEDLPKLLNSMKVGADRIQTIVRSLRNFSRMDESEMKCVDIHEGIDSTLLILQNRLKEKPDHPAIEVIKNYGPLPKVECYAGQLNQVFMNILSNALDALEERDQHRSLEEIKQHPSQIRITTKQSGIDRIKIRLADNGPGIPALVKSRLFDPFFTTKPVGKGTGLGMSISYQIVTEKHRGKLSCKSEPGQGAEFVIEIPLRQR